MLEYVDIVMSFAVVMLLLSMLVTTIVQLVIAGLGLRGSILQWGLERIIMQLDPRLADALPDQKKKGWCCRALQTLLTGLHCKALAESICREETHASKIADEVLRHSLLTHAHGQQATSIRKEELIKLLDDLAVSATSRLPPATKQLLAPVMGAAHTPEFAAGAARLATELEQAFPSRAQRVRQQVEQTLTSARTVTANVGAWFDVVMDRTSENFLLKTRWITAGVAAALAFGLQVDALNLIQQLATRPEVRAKLVQSADAVLHKAEDTFALTAAKQALASKAIAEMKPALTNQPGATQLQDIPMNLITRAEGESWLKEKLGTNACLTACLTTYDQKFEELTAVWLGALRQTTANVHTQLLATTLNVIPDPLPRPWDYSGQTAPWRHLLGILMTAVLLSLGAPFWYNMLRQLASLRPAVAEKIEPKSRRGK